VSPLPSTRRDEELMRRCLELGRRGEGRTAPNPMVGCVITDRRGKVVAEGWHRQAGDVHAEVAALARAGGKVPGGTMYTNLEPCRHSGHTPPCAPIVAQSGLTRLVVGMLDPIAEHAGGAAWLRRHGMKVKMGVLHAEVEELNRAFLVWARQGRPWFTLKAAATLDGKVATWRGESRWITGEPARLEGHVLRDRHDAILVGVGTVLADDPALSVRGVKGARDPVRVVVDSNLRTPPGAALLKRRGRGKARTKVVFAATRAAPAIRERRLQVLGADVWRLPSRGGRVDLKALGRRLAIAGITSVLVEGGPTVHGGLLEAGLADELRLFLAPIILGGEGRRLGPGWAGGRGIDHLADAWRMRHAGEPRRVGDDLLLTFRPR
jgi:diaminohydroxyphosphoribosylaminopyrimidine deaminase/5-amino-6-(5-phosphoribosylamino)uracil reductase